MIQIVPYPLWIGHGGEGTDFSRILDLGIEAIVELALEEPPRPTRRELIACRFPLLDSAGNDPKLLALAVRTVAGLISAKIPTLVCCSGGLSRSPAVVASALAVVHEELPEFCLKRVAHHHPSDVSPALWNDLVNLPTRLLSAIPAPHDG